MGQMHPKTTSTKCVDAPKRIFWNASSRRCSPRPSHSWRSEISVFGWRWPARYRRGPVDIIHDIAIHPKCKQLELFCICRKITPGPPGKLHRRSGYDLIIYVYTYIQTSNFIIYTLTLTYFNSFIYFLPSPSPNFSHPHPRSLTLRAPMMPVTVPPTRAAAAWRRRVAQEPPVVHRHHLWIHRDDPLRSKVAIRSWPVRLLFSWKFGVGNVGFSWV